METKYIISHKSPDTDTIISAIIYGEFLKKKNNWNIQICRLGELNNETKFVLEKFNLETPKIITELKENSEIILTDHNEAKQSIENREKYKIIQVIDHHKIDFNTKNPLFMRVEPIGATCSIIAKIYFENKFELTKNQASALISAIISDTLYFRSPTTTKEDIEIVTKLNEIAKIEDLEKLSLTLFDKKSDLGDISVEEIIKMDYKEFNMNGDKIGVGVIETTNPNFTLNKKEEIIKKLKDLKEKEGLTAIFLSIIDILNEKNTTIFPDNEVGNILKKSFNCEINLDENIAELKRILSRKKQIVPKLEEYFN